MAAPQCADCGTDTIWTKDGRCSQCQAFPTLGWDVIDWVEANCVIPDGIRQGEPFIPTNEQARWYLRHYRINPHTVLRPDGGNEAGPWRLPFVYFSGTQFERPQKHGKGPLASSWICAEASPDAPVLFDGWDANGQPVGRSWATPWIQVTAVSENQTDNIWLVLRPMIEQGALHADIPDTGVETINLPSGGLIERVTSSSSSRRGQRITAAAQDETSDWTERNKGVQLADTQRRNLAGTGGRYTDWCNAWDPKDGSVAQITANEAKEKDSGVFVDTVDPGEGSINNARDRKRMLKIVYGDSYWVDQDRIDAEAKKLAKRDPAQAERYYFNRHVASEDAVFNLEHWNTDLAKPDHVVPDGSLIVVGIDGARYRDAAALIATEVATGHQWPIGIWERPESAPDNYQHPWDEVDGAMTETWERYYVWRAYVDPQYIEDWFQAWQGRWGEKRVIPWRTNRPGMIAWSVRRYVEAVAMNEVSHDGDAVFAKHMGHARRQKLSVKDDKGRPMFTMSKDGQDSPDKMDAAMAGCLSWEARGDAIAADASADDDGPSDFIIH